MKIDLNSELQDPDHSTTNPCLDRDSTWAKDRQERESTVHTCRDIFDKRYASLALEVAANVGIMTIGALGSAFFHHLTRQSTPKDRRVCFVGRRSSAHNAALVDFGTFTVAAEQGFSRLSVKDFFLADLVECCDTGWLPKVLLVCTQPDQLQSTVGDYVAMLERLYTIHRIDVAVSRLPLLVLCSNGIYHERMRRFLVESLEQSMLYGRLPELWRESMGRIVGKLIRGVTVQTGYREGTGVEAIYHAGPLCRTILVGGDVAHRQACAELLNGLGGWFETDTAPPIRIEFDKALINLWANLLGQLKAIDEDGTFRLLKVGEIFCDRESTELKVLSTHLFDVGREVHAYRHDEDYEQLHSATLTIAAGPSDHVPSSLRWIDSQLRSGTLQPQLTPTERWLLDPLIKYSRTTGLDETAEYFTRLGKRVEQRLVAAIGMHLASAYRVN